MPEVAIGLFPMSAPAIFLPLARCFGLYLGLTGGQIRAADVLLRPGGLVSPHGQSRGPDAALDRLSWSDNHAPI
jgi:hypothetical protein